MRSAPPSTSTSPSFSRSWGSWTTSAGVWAGAHQTPSASNRSIHSSSGPLDDDGVEDGDDLDPMATHGGGVGEAGVVEEVGPAQRPQHGTDVAVGLEAGQKHPAAVGRPVGVHERRLSCAAGARPRPPCPAPIADPGPTRGRRRRCAERHLDHPPAAGGPLLEHGGENAGEDGQPVMWSPTPPRAFKGLPSPSAICIERPERAQKAPMS